MSWQFWKRKNEGSDQIERLHEELSNINVQMGNVTDKVTKLARAQVKSGKNIDEKMDHVSTALTELSMRKKESGNHQYDTVVRNLVHLLDEMDHVTAGLNGDQQIWHDLLTQWSRTVLSSLEEMGIFQLDVNGTTFDPSVAESLKTVPKDSLQTMPDVPYQVVEVITRGYKRKDGKIVRKAKVVTVEEEK